MASGKAGSALLVQYSWGRKERARGRRSAEREEGCVRQQEGHAKAAARTRAVNSRGPEVCGRNKNICDGKQQEVKV